MNNDQFEDLKQFIDSRISQAENTFGNKLNEEIGKLRKEMLEGFSGVGEAIENIHNQLDETKEEFDKRLTKLEQQAA